MNLRNTFILFAVLITMLWLFGLIVETRQGKIDEGYVMPGLRGESQDKIDSIEWERGDEVYLLLKKDSGWVMQRKEPKSTAEWRLEDYRINNLIREARDARRNEEADIIRDPDKAGLNPYQSKVTFRTEGAGAEYSLRLGISNDLNVFTASSDRPNRIVPVKRSQLETLLVKDIGELRSKSLLNVSTSNAQSIEIVDPKTKKEIVLKQNKQGRWMFEKPNLGAAEFEGDTSKTDSPSVRNLITTLSNLQIADFQTPEGSSLKELGVEDGSTLRVTIHRTEPGKPEGVTETLIVGNEFGKTQYYARLKRDNYAYRVDAKNLEPIFKAVNDPDILRSRDLTFITLNEPDAVDIYFGAELKEKILLRKEAPTLWKMSTGSKEVYTANQQAIDDPKGLLETLQGKNKIQKFYDGPKVTDKELGFESPTAKVEIYIDAISEEKTKEEPKDKKDDKDKKENQEKKSEPGPEFPILKKDAKPAVTLVFGNKSADGKEVNVKRTNQAGDSVRAAVPVDVLKAVLPQQGYLAFLQKELPAFPVMDATTIKLTRGNETIVVEQKKAEKDTAETWFVSQPQDLPRSDTDAAQITNLLDRLKSIQVQEWVQAVSSTDDKQLEPFGLNQPAVTVTLEIAKEVESKDKDAKDKDAQDKAREPEKTSKEVRTYRFGKIKDDGVYTLVSGTDIVFLAPKAVLEFLQKVELRDRTLFKFDADKVTEILFEGWKDIDIEGKVRTVHVQREPGKAWQTVDKKDGSLNGLRISALLDYIAELKAEKFIKFNGGAEPQHKLKIDEGGLKITFKQGKEKKEFIFTLGGLNEDKTGYFAEVSTLPGVVVLVPKTAVFDALRKDGPRYFAE